MIIVLFNGQNITVISEQYGHSAKILAATDIAVQGRSLLVYYLCIKLVLRAGTTYINLLSSMDRYFAMSSSFAPWIND